MSVLWPDDSRLERLRREHPRKKFHCGEPQVDEWLSTKALQHQNKRLSVTKVLLDSNGTINGYYTLASGHTDFDELPFEITKHLPNRILPVAVLAWLGVSQDQQGQGLGHRLLAQALRDCHDAGKIFPFVAVILDCINDRTKAFYQQWNFEEVPGRPHRMFLSTAHLEALMQKDK